MDNKLPQDSNLCKNVKKISIKKKKILGKFGDKKK
jgi:hypothetical protein